MVIKRRLLKSGRYKFVSPSRIIILICCDDLCAEARLRKNLTEYVEIGNLSHLLSKGSGI